ncbi:hypothetical protein [Thermogutta sp.]|uniref:hypothetical protein n=1 Tax=Thermogutta sp. TaxID=1962930 RepID=UPI00321FB518
MKAKVSSVAIGVIATVSWWGLWGPSPGLTESRKLADFLHGYAVQLPDNWSLKADGRMIWFTDGSRFIVIRAAAQGRLHEVMENWFWEHQALKTATGQERFAYRAHGCGLIIIGDGLGFPYGLDPMAAVNSGLTGMNPDSDYREVTVCLPGQNGVLLVSFLAPEKTSRRGWQEMVDIARTFEFVPREKLVAWSAQTILDSETGGPLGTLHVPQGAEYRGQTVILGTQRQPAIFIRQGDFLFRRDNIVLQSTVLQTQFGGNGQTILNINGASSIQPQPIFLTSVDDVEKLVLAIWQSETDESWTVTKRRDLPATPMEKASFQQAAQMLNQIATVYGRAATTSMIKREVRAEADTLVREAMITGTLLAAQQADFISASQDCTASFSVMMSQFSKENEERDRGIVVGVLASLRFSPEAVLALLQRFSIDNARLNRMVLEMVQEQQEFNSRMATAWTNALSDQTYVRDPATGEIMRLYKRAWDESDFWRDPIWNTVLGGVEPGSELEDILRSEGWRRLDQSLEGFPEQWK